MFRAIINHSVKLDIFWLLKTTIKSSLKVLVETAKRLCVVFIRGKTRKRFMKSFAGHQLYVWTEFHFDPRPHKKNWKRGYILNITQSKKKTISEYTVTVHRSGDKNY